MAVEPEHIHKEWSQIRQEVVQAEQEAAEPAGKVSVVEGEDAAFVFAPDNGWQVAEVLVDGVSAGALGSYTFKEVSANHTISVSFEESLSIADPNDTGVSDWLAQHRRS